MRTIRIGTGAGTETDRLYPALEVMEKGNVDYICFECLAERTIALAQQRKIENPLVGYNRLLEYRMKKVLPLAYEKKVKVISNMGAANVARAVEVTAEIARQLGLKGMKIAGVYGDDIGKDLEKYFDQSIMEWPDKKLGEYKDDIVSANVYLGNAGIVEALRAGADVVITGRCSDPALFIAPLVYEFGWSTDDQLGAATLLGHMLECAGQVTGGYQAVPGKNDIPDLWKLGYPIAEVSEDGTFVITKVEGSGGRVDVAGCIEQLLYETHDPENYLTPDVVADFSQVTFTQVGQDRVLCAGAKGKPRTPTLKASVGYKDSYIALFEISFGGPKCYERAVLCEEILEKRAKLIGYDIEEWRWDIIGVNSTFGPRQKPDNYECMDVRLRTAARVKDKETARTMFFECGTLSVNGPAAGGGRVETFKDVVNIISILVPREDVSVTYNIVEV